NPPHRRTLPGAAHGDLRDDLFAPDEYQISADHRAAFLSPDLFPSFILYSSVKASAGMRRATAQPGYNPASAPMTMATKMAAATTIAASPQVGACVGIQISSSGSSRYMRTG